MDHYKVFFRSTVFCANATFTSYKNNVFYSLSYTLFYYVFYCSVTRKRRICTTNGTQEKRVGMAHSTYWWCFSVKIPCITKVYYCQEYFLVDIFTCHNFTSNQQKIMLKITGFRFAAQQMNGWIWSGFPSIWLYGQASIDFAVIPLIHKRNCHSKITCPQISEQCGGIRIFCA